MPQFDYELENQLALQKMKEAQALRSAPAVAPTVKAGMYDMPNFAGIFDRFMQQNTGNRQEDTSAARLRELGQAEQGEIDPLMKQLMTPGKVLTKSLRQGEGPLMEPNIDETERGMTALEENQRQMGIGSQLMMLPKARAIGTQFVNSGVGFPEKMAQLEIKSREDMTKERLRLQERAEQNQLNRENTMAIAQLGLDGRKDMAQATRDAAQLKAQDTADLKRQANDEKKDASVAMAEQGIFNIDEMIGLRDAKGNLVEGAKPHAGFSGFVGSTWLPGARLVPGTDAAGFQARHEQVTGQARLEGVQAMKGAGAVSNAEGAAAASAITRMNKSQSEAEYVKAALEYKAMMQKGIDRNRRGMKVTPDGREYPATQEPTANPTTPTNFPRVSAATQSARDSDRVAILKQELLANPNDPQLRAELAKEQSKTTPFSPNRGDPARPAAVSSTPRTVDFGSLK